MNVVVLFSWDERLGEVGAGVPIAVGVGLEEDGARVLRLDNNLERRRDKGMKPLVGILTRLIISRAVVKVLLGCSSRTKKWEIRR